MDDEPLFRNSTVELLRAFGFECEEADGPKAALSLVAELDFDVLVTDLMMDGEPQIEFLKQVVSRSDAPGVIVVTAYPSIESAMIAVDLGLMGYVPKPFEAEELVKRIDEGIERRRFSTLLTRTESSLREASDTLQHLAHIAESGGLRVRGSHAAVPNAEIEKRLQDLTPRERGIVNEFMQGYRLATIARRLGISTHTVRRHLKSIFLKLEVNSQAELLELLKP